MQRHFASIEALQDIGDVLKYVIRVCEEMGAVRLSYHFTPLFESPNSEGTTVIAKGYDPAWLKRYEDKDMRKADPIPARTLAYGSLLAWADAIKLEPNTPENEAYFTEMRGAGLIHGFGIPLFGPRGRSAYAAFDFGVPIEQVPPDRIGDIRSISQAGHQRACILLDAVKEPNDLSQRELEVLQWLVRGKSLSVIAEILQLSPETVKTYAKRVYAKLEASDRVGAVIKALKLGLVTA